MSIPTSAFPFRRHALALALALATGASSAATIHVSGDCTLINAINNANSDTDTDGSAGCAAGSDADTLELEANATYTLTTVNNLTQGTNGLPVVNSHITINGNGSTIERSSVAGTPDFRLLEVAATGNLTLNKLQLTGGKLLSNNHVYYGGGIYSRGQLSLTDVTISGNQADNGGGLSSGTWQIGGGKVVMMNSSISDNTATDSGGGFFIDSYTIYGGDSITIMNSSISGNSAGASGGGGLILDSVLTVTNSTIANNSFGSWGGGIYVKRVAGALTNSTLSGNTGGGIYAAYSLITLSRNTF